jgi:hypothetical protein
MLIREVVEIREDQILTEVDWSKIRNALAGGLISLAVLGTPADAIQSDLDSNKINPTTAISMVKDKVASGLIKTKDILTLAKKANADEPQDKKDQQPSNPGQGNFNLDGIKIGMDRNTVLELIKQNKLGKGFSKTKVKNPESDKIYFFPNLNGERTLGADLYFKNNLVDKIVIDLGSPQSAFYKESFLKNKYGYSGDADKTGVKNIGKNDVEIHWANADGVDIKLARTPDFRTKFILISKSTTSKTSNQKTVSKDKSDSKTTYKAPPPQSPEEVKKIVDDVIKGAEKFAYGIAEKEFNMVRVKAYGQKFVLSDKHMPKAPRGNGYITWNITGLDKNTRADMNVTLVIQMKDYKISKFKWTEGGESTSYTWGKGQKDIRFPGF